MTTADRVRNRIAEILNLPLAAADDTAVLTTLVNGSFLLVELIIELQDDFDVCLAQADLNGVATVGALIELFVARMQQEA